LPYVASYLLAALWGSLSPSAKDIKRIPDSFSIEGDDNQLNKVISELNGENMEDVIAQGSGKLACVPAGGAVATPVPQVLQLLLLVPPLLQQRRKREEGGVRRIR
uniref:Large ribosomal subunit protein P2 n=1 Tax=Prolemur simus TaxID=1328070 RepID=A0A8C8YTR8_PROSS